MYSSLVCNNMVTTSCPIVEGHKGGSQAGSFLVREDSTVAVLENMHTEESPFGLDGCKPPVIYQKKAPPQISSKPSKRGRPRRLHISSESEACRNTQQCFANVTGDLKECSPKPQYELPKTCASTTDKVSKKPRSPFKLPLGSEAKVALIEKYRAEISSLLTYYHEGGRLQLAHENGKTRATTGAALRAELAIFLEESDLPFSTVVGRIVEELRVKEDKIGRMDLTLASVRSTVLSIAERICFGVVKADADVLEDDSKPCLWCWEVRDLKWLPEAQRDNIAIRRRRRRKIAERLVALSAIIEALRQEHPLETGQTILWKAEAALSRTDDESAIRAAVVAWCQKKNVKQMAKESKMKEVAVLAEQQRLNLEIEKKRRREEREAEKNRLQQEKEAERTEKEASKERARALKEALRQEKEMKRQQEEAVKNLKRRERETAELKRQSELQKQASILDRFLQSKKDHMQSSQNLYVEAKDDSLKLLRGSPSSQRKSGCQEIAASMDEELGLCCDKKPEILLSFHIAAWRNIHHLIRRKVQRWGSRRLPKVAIFKELCLQKTSGDFFQEAAFDDTQPKSEAVQSLFNKRLCQESEDDKLEFEWDEPGFIPINDCLSQHAQMDAYKYTHFHKRRKLLQFNENHRPAYYGTFSKKSEILGPRNPFHKDPSLDYEINSDDEWEEEDPGESLSDCDKEDEDEKVDMEDDDENSDGFVVPDGYLSENEGANLKETKSDDETEISASTIEAVPVRVLSSQAVESEHELQMFERQQKVLEKVTEQALRSNHVYIISNLPQGGHTLAMGRTELYCLQVLRIRVFSTGITIEPPFEDNQQEKSNETQQCKRQKKANSVLPNLVLSEMVEILSLSSQGLNKIVRILSDKFPSISRSLLKNKIREIAEFVDNHWKVKKDIVDQLGLKISSQSDAPDVVANKSPAIHLKPITNFFSKRCLPPEINGRSSKQGRLSLCAVKDVIDDENTQANNVNAN